MNFEVSQLNLFMRKLILRESVRIGACSIYDLICTDLMSNPESMN